MEGPFLATLCANVALAGVGGVEAGCGDVEMGLAIADRVRRRAVVGALDDNGLALRCELPALATA